MKLDKLEKFLLLFANVIFFVYIVFIVFWIKTFKYYADTDYLRSKLVNKIREQTSLTMDSANVSTKDMNYIFEVMGKLSYLYVAVFVILFILIVFLQIKSNGVYIFAFFLLVYSIVLLIFTLGILFLTCIIYFYIGLRLIIKGNTKGLT